MKYRATIRRCLRAVSFDAPPPPPDTEILCDGKPAGQIRSSAGNLALAFLRREIVENEQNWRNLSAAGHHLRPLPLE